MGDSSRLTWQGEQLLPEHVVAALLAPGAPFHLTEETVLGRPNQVFANRARHLCQGFDAAISRNPDLPLIVDGDRRWSSSQVRAVAGRIARVLRDDYGIVPGDRVAIAAANSPEYMVIMWAVITAGGVITSLNGWWTGFELAHGIRLSDPKLVVGDDQRLARLDADGLGGRPTVTIEALYAAGTATDEPGIAWDPSVGEDDPVMILFTSGTTGLAKGATLSHRNIIHHTMSIQLAGAIGMMLGLIQPSGEQPSSIVASPLFHVSGMVATLMTGPMLGTKLIFPPPGRWDPARQLRLTAEHRISAWSGVPTQFWRLLDEPDFDSFDLSCVRTVGGGGAPFPPELIRAYAERLPGATFGVGYGMSETAGMGTRCVGPEMIANLNTVGAPSPGMELEIRDEQGTALAAGEVGEICLRSAAVFIGYWGNEEATRVAVAPDGWYRTGDYGSVEGGRLFLASRMRDLILRGGENIYPIEIEYRLAEHPDIADAAVIGVDHPVLGQEPKAFVVVRPGAALSADEVRAWAARSLAAFKVPAHIEFRDSLPYTETGKVLKHLLEAES